MKLGNVFFHVSVRRFAQVFVSPVINLPLNLIDLSDRHNTHYSSMITCRESSMPSRILPLQQWTMHQRHQEVRQARER